MDSEGIRSSDRVYLELPINLSGTDATGREFSEDTRTLVVSRRGAKIVSSHPLLPQQTVRIHSLKTGLVSESRVVGAIAQDEEGMHYGVEVLNAGKDFWGIRFPSLEDSSSAACRVLLGCTLCGMQEVVHLDVFELEVLMAKEWLMRQCSECQRICLWVFAELEEEEPPASKETAPTPGHAVHERRSPRVNLAVDVCIRHPDRSIEVAVTENVSQGGFRFKSAMDYPIGTLIEAALPYVAAAANIFAPARIVYREELPDGSMKAYGVAYLPAQTASSLTGLRISHPNRGG